MLESKFEQLEQTIETQTWLDRVADPIGQVVGDQLQPGPVGTPLRNILDGTFLGHPLHAALTDVPMGSWSASFLLDLLSYLPFLRKLEPGADFTVGLGLAGALGSVITGLADWSYTSGTTRRFGIVHGLNQLLATSLYAGSLLSRLQGKRGLARGLGFLGYGVATFGASLGGDLAYRCGLGVNHTAFEKGSQQFVDVLGEGQLAEGQMKGVTAAGMPVLLTKRDGQVYAIGNTCTHMGCPLSEGHLDGDVVTCHCHESQFLVTTGQVIRGPADYSEPRFDVRVANGRIRVRRAEPGC